MTTTLGAPGVVITQPGVYPDLSNEDYQSDPVPGGSLSSTGARALLAPGCPAKYRHDQDHGRAVTKDLELGSAAHKLVLGEGDEIVLIDAKDYRTNAAQAARDEARARGAIPLLPDQYAVVCAMANQLRKHPLASVLFDREHGKPEQSLFWRDALTGVMCRARLDWLPDERLGRSTIYADYKTTRCGAPSKLGRAAADYGYHQQAAFYLDGIAALHLAARPVFWFCYQEKTPPYLVTVSELDGPAMQIGRERNRRAIDTYARCVASGQWPGYSDAPVVTSLPAWVEMSHAAGDDWATEQDTEDTDGW